MSDNVRSMEELFNIVDSDVGVRCSATDPAAYSRPEDHHFEKSSGNLASVGGGRFGSHGVVVPRATRLGGSKGCDPSRPGMVYVNPGDKDGLSCAVDFNVLSKQDVADAYRKAASSGSEDPAAVATKTFLVLSEMTRNKSRQESPPRNSDPIRKVVPVLEAKPAITEMVAERKPDRCVRATIDIGKSVSVDAHYYDVVQSGDFLILVSLDGAAGKFMPKRSEEPVMVALEDGRTFRTISAGIRFSFGGYDFCVLLIESAGDL